MSKCICQSNVKSFKSVADDIRQPKLSHVKLWTQKRVKSLLPGKDKTRANKLKPIKSHLRSNKQNQGWKIKLHYVVADGLIEGHCICLLQQICCLKESSFRYTYIVSNEDAFVSAICGYLCKVNIVCFPKKKPWKKINSHISVPFSAHEPWERRWLRRITKERSSM